MQNVKISSLPIYKNFGKKIEKIKQIAEIYCGYIKNRYNEGQEKTISAMILCKRFLLQILCATATLSQRISECITVNLPEKFSTGVLLRQNINQNITVSSVHSNTVSRLFKQIQTTLPFFSCGVPAVAMYGEIPVIIYILHL